MKTYKAKSSAIRAAKKAYGSKWNEEGILVVVKGLWGFEHRPNKPVVKEEKTSPKKTKRVYANLSSCGKPCKVVWDIAMEMGNEAKRKDVLAACEEAGVTFYTARTQYQKYKEALRGDVK